MTENKDELPRLHIFVDGSKVVRCKWCGTTQSEKWIPAGFGDFYCSDNCKRAAEWNPEGYGFCTFGFTLLLFLVIIFTGLPWEILLPGILIMSPLFILLPVIMYFRKPPEDYKEKVPKNSRWNEGLSDLSLLKTITSHAVCPNCDGNLDLSKVTQDMVYACEYCGASGKIEVVKMKQ